MRVLVLALGVPFPPIGGGLTRSFHLLQSLSSHHRVSLVAFTYGETHEPAPFPIELRTAPWTWSSDYLAMTSGDAEGSRHAYERLTYTGEQPWFVSVLDPEPMRDAIALALQARPDVVVLEGTPMAAFLPIIPPQIPRVLDLFDIHSVLARQQDGSDPAGSSARAREADRTLAFERAAAAQCDASLAVSDHDADVARHLLGAANVHVVPNGVDTTFFAPRGGDSEPGALLFTGRMSYSPNADAVEYFVKDILPLVRRQVTHATVHVVGAGPPAVVTGLAAPDVIVHGRVDDVRPFHSRAEVAVVPIRTGGGTRLKVLEAAASAKAIVSTTLGAQGLPFQHGEHILIADTPSEFAVATVSLLRDPARRTSLGARARQAALDFDWQPIGQSFRRILEDVVRDRA